MSGENVLWFPKLYILVKQVRCRRGSSSQSIWGCSGRP